MYKYKYLKYKQKYLLYKQIGGILPFIKKHGNDNELYTKLYRSDNILDIIKYRYKIANYLNTYYEDEYIEIKNLEM